MSVYRAHSRVKMIRKLIKYGTVFAGGFTVGAILNYKVQEEIWAQDTDVIEVDSEWCETAAENIESFLHENSDRIDREYVEKYENLHARLNGYSQEYLLKEGEEPVQLPITNREKLMLVEVMLRPKEFN